MLLKRVHQHRERNPLFGIPVWMRGVSGGRRQGRMVAWGHEGTIGEIGAVPGVVVYVHHLRVWCHCTVRWVWEHGVS